MISTTMQTAQSLVIRLLLFSAAEAFGVTLLFSEYLPQNPFFWTLVQTLAVNAVLFGTWRTVIYPYLLSPLRHLPQPKGWSYPLLGHGPSLFQRPPCQDFYKWMCTIPNDGLLMFHSFGHQPTLILTNPRALAEVLVHKSYDFKKPTPIVTFLRRVLGDGLVVVEGSEHKFQRKHVMPVFSFRHIKDLYPMMWRKAVDLTRAIEAEMDSKLDLSSETKSQGNVIEINHWANKATMDIIGVAGLGRDFNALKNSNDPLVSNYEEILEPTAEKLSYFACQIIFPQGFINRLPWRMNQVMKTVTDNLNRICTELVRDKRELIKTHADKHLDILSVLIKSNNFNDQQLVDQLLTFLAAGHETTSSAFTWTTYLLSTHPDIQTSLRKEVLEAFSEDAGTGIDLASRLDSLPILNGVCNETLRLYPTVPLTLRECCTETTICDQVIPVGTQLIIIPWATNRLPEFWGPDANKFKPERWIDQETGKPNNTGGSSSNYNILTFLHGPRSCIGKDFAKAELKCLVATFIMAFEMEIADTCVEAVPHGVITTKPKYGMPLRLKKLNNIEKHG